jgi:hypothetical protein
MRPKPGAGDLTRIRLHTTFSSVREPYLVEQSGYCDLLRRPLTAGCTSQRLKKAGIDTLVDARVLAKKKKIITNPYSPFGGYGLKSLCGQSFEGRLKNNEARAHLSVGTG